MTRPSPRFWRAGRFYAPAIGSHHVAAPAQRGLASLSFHRQSHRASQYTLDDRFGGGIQSEIDIVTETTRSLEVAIRVRPWKLGFFLAHVATSS